MLPLSWNLAFKIHVILTVDALENNTAVSLILLKSNVRGKSMKIYALAMETKRYFKKIREKKLGHPYLYYTLGTVVACLS